MISNLKNLLIIVIIGVNELPYVVLNYARNNDIEDI